VRTPTKAELRELAIQLEAAIDRGVDEARVWLASEQGRRYRAFAARALILAAPLIVRHPVFKTPLGRVVQIAGGATLIVKVAELLRDWEPTVPATLTSRAATLAPR
jgi:hypothetical protein